MQQERGRKTRSIVSEYPSFKGGLVLKEKGGIYSPEALSRIPAPQPEDYSL